MSVLPTAALATPQATCLLFADISGYTHFIRENPFTAAHALDAVSQLLDRIIDTLEPVFVLAKLEGDAAFCHAPPHALQGGAVPELLLQAFTAFAAQKAQLIACNTCQCVACRALDQLELKLLLHQGDVLHFKTRLGPELGGLPVIVLHRLCKNSVPSNRYILWTDTLAGHLVYEPATTGVEHCEELGEIGVNYFTDLPVTGELPQAALLERLQDHWHKSMLWLPLYLQGKRGRAAALGPG